VLVADRDWRGPARDAGWTVDAAFERRVHRSLTRHVLVLRHEEAAGRTGDPSVPADRE
ncbi:TIGR01177 family methyltransferase, partial [Halorubrum sp. SP9]